MAFVIGFILGAVACSAFWFFSEHREAWDSLTDKVRGLFKRDA